LADPPALSQLHEAFRGLSFWAAHQIIQFDQMPIKQRGR
jgi:hypothetical protein